MRFYTKPDPPVAGSITLNVFAGVALCEGFDTVALWLDSAQSHTLTYPANATLRVVDGLHVDNNLTVAELKSICTQLGLSTGGLKADLLARVQEATS